MIWAGSPIGTPASFPRQKRKSMLVWTVRGDPGVMLLLSCDRQGDGEHFIVWPILRLSQIECD